MKRFDFSLSAPSIPFFKRLRIHPSFPAWRAQVLLFTRLLVGIFFLSIFAEGIIVWSTISAEWKAVFTSQHLQIKKPHNLEEFQTQIRSLQETLQPIFQDIETQFPPSSFSFVQSIKDDAQNTLGITARISQNIPLYQTHLEQSIQQKSAHLLLQDIHTLEPQLLDLSQSLQSLRSKTRLIPSISQKFSIIDPYISFMDDTAIKDSFQLIRTVLGDEKPFTVLILLQNAYERRLGGGFIGSFFEVHISKGNITTQFRDIYSLDKKITSTAKPPLLGKTLVGDTSWSLRDANVFPDFQDSAKTFIQFYKQAGGGDVDAVLALDNTIIESLLKRTGAVYVPDVKLSLNADNFSFIVSYIVEGKLMPHAKEEILSKSVLPAIEKEVKKNISLSFLTEFIEENKRHIAFYSSHENIQTLVRVLDTGNQFSALIKSSNIIPVGIVSVSGNKSDAFIEESLILQSKDNTYTLQMERTHTWGKKEEAEFNALYKKFGTSKYTPKKELHAIMGAGSNHDIVYIFLPREAKHIVPPSNTERCTTYDAYERQVIECTLLPLFPQKSQSMQWKFTLPWNNVAVTPLF